MANRGSVTEDTQLWRSGKGLKLIKQHYDTHIYYPSLIEEAAEAQEGK